MALSNNSPKKLYRIIKDNPLVALPLLSIKSKDEGLVRLNPNYTQVAVISAIHDMYSSLGYARVKVIKYRQGGCSTGVSGHQFLTALTTPDINCLTISHDPDTSRHIFGMIDTYHRNLHRLIKPGIRASRYRE